MAKKLVVIVLGCLLVGGVVIASLVFYLSSNLPKLNALNDYAPKLLSEVYDINNKKIGELFDERRILIPYENIPIKLVQAFVAAEDSKFFEHGGIDYIAMLRAMLTNIKEGRKAQGASTITQQVARSLLLTSDKTYDRKVREILLAYKIESNLTKEQIIYLYLNQIFFGQRSNGVEIAARSYFRKSAKDLQVAEMAILAGLPQAPSRYSPTSNPVDAKRRQRYVLERMAVEGFITHDEAKAAAEQPVTLYMLDDYQEIAPHFIETVRQYLVKELGNDVVMDTGIKIHTTLDIDKQLVAQEKVQQGLRDLDKKQGFRGATANLTNPEEIATFLTSEKNAMISKKTPIRVLQPDGTLVPRTDWEKIKATRKNVPPYIAFGEIINGVVTKIDDPAGLVTVRFAESQGLISIESMSWARKPNPKTKLGSETITKPSQALKVGDVIEVRVVDDIFKSESLSKKVAGLKKDGKPVIAPDVLAKLSEYAQLELEQLPLANAGLLSLDIKKQNVIAMVGGYDNRSKFNRTIQAVRQTGSSFKPLIYAAALDSSFTPASVVMDAPIVYQDDTLNKMKNDTDGAADAPKAWKPNNYGAKFSGDILFRNALIQSKNIPTIRILDGVGVERGALYARRLGVFNKLNMDLTLGLGSSSVTLYEMTKAFSVFANNGKRMRPRMLTSVEDRNGKQLLKDVSLDTRFETELETLDKEMEERRQKSLDMQKTTPEVFASREPKDLKDPAKAPIFFQDPEQLIRPQTAYLMTTIMSGVINDPNGTGGKARAVGKPLAGKTGSTSDYFDAWFVGYSPEIATGVWVGYDDERSLGVGATGGDAALPMWTEYMKYALKDSSGDDFQAPSGIVFANIDNDTGRLASATSRRAVRQAFLEGTEPGGANAPQQQQEAVPTEDKDFFKDDLSN